MRGHPPAESKVSGGIDSEKGRGSGRWGEEKAKAGNVWGGAWGSVATAGEGGWVSTKKALKAKWITVAVQEEARSEAQRHNQLPDFTSTAATGSRNGPREFLGTCGRNSRPIGSLGGE